MDAGLSAGESWLNQQREKLTAVSPASVLDRGFAFIADANGKAVRRAAQLKTGDAFSATFADGRIDAEVMKGGKEEENE